MYFIDVAPRDYADPWQEDFWTRLAALRRGSRRVAYFYEKPDNSTFRYRAYNMVQVLGASVAESGVSAGYFFATDGDRIDHVLDLADVIVLCRMRYDATISHIVGRARAAGKPVFYDVDDLVFDTDLTHLILGTLAQDFKHPGVWDHWFAYISRIGTTLRLCDAAITTNPHLAERITAYSGKPAFVVPNFMNWQQLDFSRQLYEDKQARGFARNGLCHIGYFSGTPTHKRDFDVAVPALAALLARRDDLRLLVVGYLTLPPALERFRERILQYSLHDFVNLQRIVSLVEINIVPLVDNVFTACKSELKYFEAAAVGTVTVASPSPTYGRAITHGVNGWLASSLEWEERIEQAIDAIGGSQAPVEAARRHALDTYSGASVLPAILEAVTWRP
jgi:glycosyltransferase involved in cell wall biosynthesis